MIGERWPVLRAALDAERLHVQAEISAYPPPIPACDVHFNYLLERRAALCDAIERVDRAIAQPAIDEAQAALESYLESCPHAFIRALCAGAP